MIAIRERLLPAVGLALALLPLLPVHPSWAGPTPAAASAHVEASLESGGLIGLIHQALPGLPAPGTVRIRPGKRAQLCGPQRCPIAGRTLYVAKSGPTLGGSCATPDFRTITAAAAAVESGDELYICEGVWREPQLVFPVSSLTITGEGEGRTIIDGELVDGDPLSRHQVMALNLESLNDTLAATTYGVSTLQLSNLSIRHGIGLQSVPSRPTPTSPIAPGLVGGAVIAQTLETNRVTFSENSALIGGAVFAGFADIQDSTFVGNGLVTGSTLPISLGSAIIGIYGLTIRGSEFDENHGFSENSDQRWGSAALGLGPVVVVGSTFMGNTNNSGTSALVAVKNDDGPDTSLIVSNSTFIGNTTGEGAAVLADSATITYSSFIDNVSSDDLAAAVVAKVSATLANNLIVGAHDQCTLPAATGHGNITTDAACGGVLESRGSIGDLAPEPASPGSRVKVVRLGGSSTAKDAGDCAAGAAATIVVDQVGLSRPSGAACDAGSTEFHTPGAYIAGDGGTCAAPVYSTVTDAVAAAVADDTIHVCAGWYREPELKLGPTQDRLTIEGDGFSQTIIAGEQNQGVASSRHRIIDATDLAITFRNLSLIDGAAAGSGGAVVAYRVTAQYCEFRSNTADYGGAIATLASPDHLEPSVTLDSSRLLDNGGDATQEGGAVYAPDSTVSITAVDMADNRAAKTTWTRGGAVSGGTVDVHASDFLRNSASGRGGAVHADAVTVEGSRFTGNSATEVGSSFGGAISAWTSVSTTHSEFDGNVAAFGGALSVSGGSVVLAASSFVGNHADPPPAGDARGGAVYSLASTTSAVNSTFVANTAGTGGAFYISGLSYFTNDTFLANVSEGGGIMYASDDVWFANSILDSDGSTSCIIGGAQIDGGGNLQNGTNCAGTNISAADLKFSALSLEGQLLMAPLHRGSIAMNAGNVTTCTNAPVSNVDQRGVPRNIFGACDSGAYEFTGPILSTTTTASVSTGPYFMDGTLSVTATVTRNYPVRPTLGAPDQPATGYVTFYFCFGNDSPSTCSSSSGTAIGSPVRIASDGTATLRNWTPTQGIGYYLFVAVYGGDDYSLPSTQVVSRSQVISVTYRVLNILGKTMNRQSGDLVGQLYLLQWEAPEITPTSLPACFVYTNATYTHQVTLDASTPRGRYVIHCSGAAMPSGWLIHYSDGVLTIGELPATGANTAPILLVGGVFVGLGALALLLGERRKRRH